MDKLTLGASILGLMVIGAMPATLMTIRTPIAISNGASPVTLQSILDQIVPDMIPLLLTFLVYFGIRRGIKTIWLLLGLLALGLLGSWLHLFN
jgi:PTS system mannose-specific IID component